jgi:magnesium-transporting ATPase (P-type)
LIEGANEIEKLKEQFVQKRKSAVIVSGDALSVIMGEEGIKKRFLEIALMVDVVLACRVSPKQKADIV